MFPFRRRSNNNDTTTTIIKPTTTNKSKTIQSTRQIQVPSNQDDVVTTLQCDSSGHWTATTTTTTTTESSRHHHHSDHQITETTDVSLMMKNNTTEIITDAVHIDTREERIRFGTAFGFALEKNNNNNTKSDQTSSESSLSSTTTTTTNTLTLLPELSSEAQRHYDTFQQWKAQHASYLYRASPLDGFTATATGTTVLTNHCTTTTDTCCNTGICAGSSLKKGQQQDRMDELEWYNAFQYAIQYHLVNDNKNNNNNNNSLGTQIDNSHHHFRIIATPQQSTATTTNTTPGAIRVKQSSQLLSTKSSTNPQFTQQRRNHILYVLPAGMNISILPILIPSNNVTSTTNQNHHHHHHHHHHHNNNNKNNNNNNNNNKKDVTKQMMDVYTTAFAVYIYRTLFVISNHTLISNTEDVEHRNPNATVWSPNVTIVLDVRKGGPHWPNIPAIQFISFIRHVGTILPYYFPGICTQCIIYPIPAIACTLYNVCIKPILDKSIQQMIHLVTTATARKGGNNNIDDENDDTFKVNYQSLEEFRMQIIQATPATQHQP